MKSFIIEYAGEQARSRFWQEAALTALGALIASSPPSRETEIERSPAGIEDYARNMARAAFTIADEMYKQHGPSISSRLQDEDPFVAADQSVGGTD